MDYTRLGSSGLVVSRICLGCMSFGDKNAGRLKWILDDTEAAPIFRKALDLGITFWDTANIYGYGTSEEVTGRAMREISRREDIVLATKLFQRMYDGPGGGGLSRRAVMEQIDASLIRLGTDYVDLLQIHRFDPTVPVDETMEALHDVVKAGKVRYLGASSMWAWQLAKMQEAARSNGWTPFISMQDQYSLIQREEEREMFGLLADSGVGSLPWSPLAAGLVARPWGEKSTTRGAANPVVDQYGRPLFLDSDKAIVDAVQRIAESRGIAMATVAMAWVLRNPVVDSPIVGATKDHHLTDAVAALDVDLTDEEVAALEEHYTPPRADVLLIGPARRTTVPDVTDGGRVLSTDVRTEPLAPDELDAASVVAGSPRVASVDLADVDDVAIGVWEITEGAVTDTEVDEVFLVLSGSGRIDIDDGTTVVIGPGALIRLRAGDRTTWTITETVRKVFVILPGPSGEC